METSLNAYIYNISTSSEVTLVNCKVSSHYFSVSPKHLDSHIDYSVMKITKEILTKANINVLESVIYAKRFKN